MSSWHGGARVDLYSSAGAGTVAASQPPVIDWGGAEHNLSHQHFLDALLLQGRALKVEPSTDLVGLSSALLWCDGRLVGSRRSWVADWSLQALLGTHQEGCNRAVGMLLVAHVPTRVWNSHGETNDKNIGPG